MLIRTRNNKQRASLGDLFLLSRQTSGDYNYLRKKPAENTVLEKGEHDPVFTMEFQDRHRGQLSFGLKSHGKYGVIIARHQNKGNQGDSPTSVENPLNQLGKWRNSILHWSMALRQWNMIPQNHYRSYA